MESDRFVFDVAGNNLATIDCDGVLRLFGILFRMEYLRGDVGIREVILVRSSLV